MIQEEDEKIEKLQEKENCLTDNLIEEAKQRELTAESAITDKWKEKLKGLTQTKDLE